MKPHSFYLRAGSRNIDETSRSTQRRDWVATKKPSRFRNLDLWLAAIVGLLVIVYATGIDEIILDWL